MARGNGKGGVFNVTLTGPWESFIRGLSKEQLKTKLAKEFKIANELNGAIMAESTRRNIQGGVKGIANRPLTVDLKGSSKPLVDEGDLMVAITWKLVSWDIVEFGLFRSEGVSAKELRVIYGLHEGRRIMVTKKMRTMFQFLHNVTVLGDSPSTLTGRAAELYADSPGTRWFPLNPSTNHIYIRKRPFIKWGIRDRLARRAVVQNWKTAAVRSFIADGLVPASGVFPQYVGSGL